MRYKIKLVAANYLPAITVSLPHVQRIEAELARKPGGKSITASSDDASLTGMHAGRTYQFHLALSNPLYDPIQVRLSAPRIHVSTAPSKDQSSEKTRRPPYAVSLPSSAFAVAAFAEAWEYEDDEDMFGVDDGDQLGQGGRETDGRGKVRTVGVLERRANVTLVGGEVVIGKDARGEVKVRPKFFN